MNLAVVVRRDLSDIARFVVLSDVALQYTRDENAYGLQFTCGVEHFHRIRKNVILENCYLTNVAIREIYRVLPFLKAFSITGFSINCTSKAELDEQAVTIIGLEEVIVVVTEDAILVTNKKDSHQIKAVIAELEENKQTQLL